MKASTVLSLNVAISEDGLETLFACLRFAKQEADRIEKNGSGGALSEVQSRWLKKQIAELDKVFMDAEQTALDADQKSKDAEE